LELGQLSIELQVLGACQLEIEHMILGGIHHGRLEVLLLHTLAKLRLTGPRQ
jgi:hypothetical protein